jgi:hypothetical protein
MGRIHRRAPTRRPDPSDVQDSREAVCQAYGWPDEVDPRRLGDPDYQEDVLEPYRRSIGWHRAGTHPAPAPTED